MYQNYFNARTSYEKLGDNKPYYVSNTMEPAVNSILASVHQRLKYNPKLAVPRIPKAIAETMSRRTPEVLLLDSNVKNKKRNTKNSISQLQADRELKSMEQARRYGLTSDMMSFPNQKRYRELLCQKRILEEMLKEHQKLQTDRDNIASEINYMRSYLDSIRNKLDVSLRRLNSHRTIAEIATPKKEQKSKPQLRRPTTCPRPIRNAPTRIVKSNRIAGGFDVYTGRSKLASNMSAFRNLSRTAGEPRVQTKPASCPCKRGSRPLSKQWVYATRIDRKEELAKSIFI